MANNSVRCRFNAGTPAQCKNMVNLANSGGRQTCSYHRNFNGTTGTQSSGVSLATVQRMSTLQPVRFRSVLENGNNAMNAKPRVTPSHANGSVQMLGWTQGDKIFWKGRYVDVPYQDGEVSIQGGSVDGVGAIQITDIQEYQAGNPYPRAEVTTEVVNSARRYYSEAVATRFGFLDGSSTAERYEGGVPQILAQLELGEDQNCRVSVTSNDEPESNVTERIRFEFANGDEMNVEVYRWPLIHADSGAYLNRWKLSEPKLKSGQPVTEEQMSIYEDVQRARQIIGEYQMDMKDGSVLMPVGWVERDHETFERTDKALAEIERAKQGA